MENGNVTAKASHGFGILACIAVGISLNWYCANSALAVLAASKGKFALGDCLVWGWLGTIALMIGLIRLSGYALNGKPSGVLIDNRNRISLSKLQAIAWTVVIVSGLSTIGAARIIGIPASLSIDGYLLALMGISAASLVATPAILSIKNEQVESRVGQGVGAARWMDLFRGDDEANKDAPDLSKIQQILVTLVVMAIYLFMLGNSLHLGIIFSGEKGERLVGLRFPKLDQQLLWLIGISHAGYLGYKAAPHSATDSTRDTAKAADDGAVG
jgi:hypothetical protein